MKSIIKTTTGVLPSRGVLYHCGDYAGKFQNEAIDLLFTIDSLPEWQENAWADIMCNKHGSVFAIYAEDTITSSDAVCFFAELEYDDCPDAFEAMKQIEF
jgi:hypothetical protein